MMHGSLPARLRLLRARQGLTLIDAAAKLGIGRDTLSDLERGIRRPVMPTLAKIAAGYGVDIEDLLDESEEVHTPKAEAPQLTAEQFADHNIQPTSDELAALNELLKTYTEIAQTGAKRGNFLAPPGVDVRRVDMLFWHAARSGILTPEDLFILEHGVARELAAGRP